MQAVHDFEILHTDESVPAQAQAPCLPCAAGCNPTPAAPVPSGMMAIKGASRSEGGRRKFMPTQMTGARPNCFSDQSFSDASGAQGGRPGKGNAVGGKSGNSCFSSVMRTLMTCGHARLESGRSGNQQFLHLGNDITHHVRLFGAKNGVNQRALGMYDAFL